MWTIGVVRSELTQDPGITKLIRLLRAGFSKILGISSVQIWAALKTKLFLVTDNLTLGILSDN